MSIALPELVGRVVVDGRPMWVFDNGYALPVVSGGSDVPPATPAATPPAPTATPPAPAPAATPSTAQVTMTQDELNAKMAAEKAQGRVAAEKAIAGQLGCTLEEAKAKLDAANQAEQAALTDTQRAQAAAEKAKADAEVVLAEAKADRHQAAVERALSKAGVGEENLTLVAKLVEADTGADAAVVAAAVETLKTQMPALFAAAGTPAAPATPGIPPSTPGAPPAQQNGNDAMTTAYERGKAAATQRSPLGSLSIPA